MEFPPLHGRREPLEKSIFVVERNRIKMRPKNKIKFQHIRFQNKH
jgi:hypothetical protein